MTDRRQQARVAGGGVCARIRLGHRLLVVDVSTSGALVEGPCPLRPGSRIEVQLDTEIRGSMVVALVTRCAVSAIDPAVGVTYRSALVFAESCDWVREAMTQAGYHEPELRAGAGA
jgi:hypothetical protein